MAAEGRVSMPAKSADAKGVFSIGWREVIAGVLTVALTGGGAAWLSDHYVFGAQREQLAPVIEKVNRMPSADQVVPRSEHEQRWKAEDERLDRIEEKQDRMLDLLIDLSKDRK